MRRLWLCSDELGAESGWVSPVRQGSDTRTPETGAGDGEGDLAPFGERIASGANRRETEQRQR